MRSATPREILVQNFFEELRQVVPEGMPVMMSCWA